MCVLLMSVSMSNNTIAQTNTSKPNLLSFCSLHRQEKVVSDLWHETGEALADIASNAAQDPKSLYNLQTYTNNLLLYSFESQNFELSDSLLNLYLTTLKSIVRTNEYAFQYFPQPNVRRTRVKLSSEIGLWLQTPATNGLRHEDVLSSSQFIFLISNAFQLISEIVPDNRTRAMQEFLTKFTPVLKSHLRRWVLGSSTKEFNSVGPFQRRAWGCKHPSGSKQSGLTHIELIDAITANEMNTTAVKTLCNATTDTDLWVIAAVANLLYTQHSDENVLMLDHEIRDSYKDYLQKSGELLKSKTAISATKDFSGDVRDWVNFDAGSRDSTDSYSNTGCTNENFETVFETKADSSCATTNDSAWDIGHASRFVHVFDSLMKTADTFDLPFPDDGILRGFSNAFAYRVFNGDLEKPLFNNFMDGSNGWYRVGYSGQKGFGIGPFNLSSLALTGGYARWTIYNPDIELIYESLLAMLENKSSASADHVDKYYNHTHWRNFRKFKQYDFLGDTDLATNLALMQFYPALCR